MTHDELAARCRKLEEDGHKMFGELVKAISDTSETTKELKFPDYELGIETDE